MKNQRLIDANEVFDKMRDTFDMQELYLPIHFQELIIDEMPTIQERYRAVILTDGTDKRKAIIDEQDGEVYFRRIGINRDSLEDFGLKEIKSEGDTDRT